VLDPSLYGFVLRYSLHEQVYLVVVTLLSFPFLYYSLELPKVIISQAIAGKHFPRELLGLELGQIPYLGVLCGIFLALVLSNGWFKYHLNVRKGRVGGLRREFAGRSLFATLSRPEAARGFDRVLVMDHGRLVTVGDYATLTRPDGPLAPLLAAE
jgi:hypothetical protein